MIYLLSTPNKKNKSFRRVIQRVWKFPESTEDEKNENFINILRECVTFIRYHCPLELILISPRLYFSFDT